MIYRPQSTVNGDLHVASLCDHLEAELFTGWLRAPRVGVHVSKAKNKGSGKMDREHTPFLGRRVKDVVIC